MTSIRSLLWLFYWLYTTWIMLLTVCFFDCFIDSSLFSLFYWLFTILIVLLTVDCTDCFIDLSLSRLFHSLSTILIVSLAINYWLLSSSLVPFTALASKIDYLSSLLLNVLQFFFSIILSATKLSSSTFELLHLPIPSSLIYNIETSDLSIDCSQHESYLTYHS